MSREAISVCLLLNLRSFTHFYDNGRMKLAIVKSVTLIWLQSLSKETRYQLNARIFFNLNCNFQTLVSIVNPMILYSIPFCIVYTTYDCGLILDSMVSKSKTIKQLQCTKNNKLIPLFINQSNYDGQVIAGLNIGLVFYTNF